MNAQRWLDVSERWIRFLVRLYPVDFREEMGGALVEAYRDRCRVALREGARFALFGVWLRALFDSVRNGLGERVRPAAPWRRGGNWGRDMELATRRLVRAPVFALAMIGTLGIGLGAFAVVYAFVHKVLIAPLPYERPDDLYFVWRDYGPIVELNRGWLGGTDVAELQKVGGVIEDAAGMLRGRLTLSGRDGRDATEISVIATSPNLFELLGVRPALGRGFAPDEVGPGRPAVAVLTHELWNGLGADPSIIGTEIRLNDEPYTVIGVMPRRFTFVRSAGVGAPQRADAYTTLSVNLAETNPMAGSYAGLIRARPGSSAETVGEAVDAVGKGIDERDFESLGLKLYAIGLKPDLVASVRPALVVLGLAGVFLLLVLMVNLATLLVARASQREQEFAVSRALGASPIALARGTLVEGGMLGLMGGVAGALVAVWGTRVAVALAPTDLPRRDSIAVDPGIGAVVVGVGVLLGLLAATLPAAWAARAPLSSLLSNASVRGGGGQGRMRRGMVVVQVALSLVLLSTGGLVVRSFERLLRVDPGFDPDGVLTFRVPMPSQRFPEATDALALQDRLQVELAALPGVDAVSAASALPLSTDASQTNIEIPGAPGNTGDLDYDRPLVDYIGIRAEFVGVMGIRMLAGRMFDSARREGVREALIDRVLADHFFPAGNPIGTKLPFRDDTLMIVGVVQQPRLYDVHQDSRGQLFIRAEDWGYRTLSFVLRSDRDPRALIPFVRSVARRIDPQLALAEVRTMDEIVADALSQQRISAVLIAGFALGALLLAAMGLFGVVSGSVLRRRHELAVRLALGAEPRRVRRLVIGEGVRLVLIGVLIGAPGVYGAGRAIRGVLVGVSPSDPTTLIGVALGLTAIAVAACYVPARRVSRIDPARSLRQE
jgi:putative ABC transport system permease protein